MIVLDGDVTHRKRSGAARPAIGPAAASPATIARIESRCARTASASRSGASDRSAVSWRSPRAAFMSRYLRVRQNTTTPTLTSSPRSTRGATRNRAYSNGSRGTPDLLDRIDQGLARSGANREVADVRLALLDWSANQAVRLEPGVGDQRHDLAEQPFSDLRREPFVGLGERGGERQQDVI